MMDEDDYSFSYDWRVPDWANSFEYATIDDHFKWKKLVFKSEYMTDSNNNRIFRYHTKDYNTLVRIFFFFMDPQKLEDLKDDKNVTV